MFRALALRLQCNRATLPRNPSPLHRLNARHFQAPRSNLGITSAAAQATTTSNMTHRKGFHSKGGGARKGTSAPGRPRGRGGRGQGLSRKRKAEDPLPEQSIRRFKLERPRMEYDLATILETQELPDQNELPNAQEGWMDNPKLLFFNGGLARWGTTSLEAEGGAAAHFRTRVTFRMLTGSSVDALGEGSNKKAAEKAACIHLLCKLHSDGSLKQAFSSETVDEQTIKEEQDAKVDIYNYAARFGALPVFSETSFGKASTGRYRGRGRGARAPNVYQTTIELPEQGIKATGIGRSKEIAEIAAALNFKSEAEKYQSAQGTDSLVVRDSSALGVANARAFFDFCKNNRIDYRASVETTNQRKSFVYAQPILNGEALGEPVALTKKKQAEDVGYLVAALAVTKKEPTLLTKFQRALKQGGGRILPNVPWVDCALDSDVADLMHDTIRRARSAGLDDKLMDLESHEAEGSDRRPLRRHILSADQAEVRSAHLRHELERYESDPELVKLRQTKAELPMNQHANEVLELLESNAFSIVIGATGSGKTTQVPQIVLDDAIRSGKGGSCNIICTQPRRIAATSVGRRVADERAQRLQESVGYHVRHDAKLPRPGGSIAYCTTGILLQQLQHGPDEILDSVSHLIIDEVHERDILIDFLLTIVKNVLAQRRASGRSCPKVVLMSATMDSDLFSGYFSGFAEDGTPIECPTLRVPGRLFPVTERYLDGILQDLVTCHGESALSSMFTDPLTKDYLEYEKEFARNRPQVGEEQDGQVVEEDTVIDWKREAVVTKDGEASVNTDNEDAMVPVGLMAATIAHIAKTTQEGAILAFLPGLDEMLGVQRMLVEQRLFGVDVRDESRFKTFLLHSSVQDSQREVFDPVPPGCRKIILATNIAETSVTIADVQYVVDTGKLREKRYDQLTRITKLQCTWVSKSNAKQRAGRAGRVQNGHYFALFTRSRREALRAVGLPEILRSDLQKVCLDVKAQRFKAPVRQFLADAIEPPSPAAVDKSMDSLIDLDCLTDDEKLTALGRLLASLPVHPSLGKMIVLGVIFRCLDPMLVIGAAAEDRDLFVQPPERRSLAQEAKKSFLRGSESDHIAFLNAFRELRHVTEARGQWASRDFAMQNFLHIGAFRSISSAAQQIEQVFVEAGLIPSTAPEQRVDWQYGAPHLNDNSANVDLVKALALAGLQPNIAVRINAMLLRAPTDPNTLFHPSSVNAIGRDVMKKIDSGVIPRPSFRNQLYTYSVMAKSNDGRSTFLRQTTRVTPLMAMLFGSRLQPSTDIRRLLEVDGWLPVCLNQAADARSVLAFRRALERMQAEAFRDLASAQPLAEHPVREIFAEALGDILETTSSSSSIRPVNGSSRTQERYHGWGDSYERGDAISRRDSRDYRASRNDREDRRGRDRRDLGFDVAFEGAGGGDYYRPARQ